MCPVPFYAGKLNATAALNMGLSATDLFSLYKETTAHSTTLKNPQPLLTGRC